MSVKIKEDARCACGTPLDEINNFVNNKQEEVCEGCWMIELTEDEVNE